MNHEWQKPYTDATARRLGKDNPAYLRYQLKEDRMGESFVLAPVFIRVHKLDVMARGSGVDEYPTDKYSYWTDRGILCVGNHDGVMSIHSYNSLSWNEVTLFCRWTGIDYLCADIDKLMYVTTEQIAAWDPKESWKS